MLLTRWEPKSWWISAMCPDSHTRWTTAPSRFACVHVFFFFSFFALLPVSHSATLLYNSLVLTPAISLLFIPSHSSHSKEYKEDAARPSASCVPFLLVTQTKKKRRKKSLHKLRHLLQSLKRCQLSHSYRMTTTCCVRWHRLQQRLASSESECKM